jgi:hypothetical protein
MFARFAVRTAKRLIVRSLDAASRENLITGTESVTIGIESLIMDTGNVAPGIGVVRKPLMSANTYAAIPTFTGPSAGAKQSQAWGTT